MDTDIETIGVDVLLNFEGTGFRFEKATRVRSPRHEHAILVAVKHHATRKGATIVNARLKVDPRTAIVVIVCRRRLCCGYCCCR